ncbi:hypothetical protein CCP3SC15_90030 [Gammaproteobacteria bacterium]
MPATPVPCPRDRYRVRKFKFVPPNFPRLRTPLGPVDPASAPISSLGTKRVLYLGAVQDRELAPEMDIGGKIHGALSVALARGLKGAADINQDGVITAAELETYVRETVQTLMEGQQHPSLMRGSDISLTVRPSNASPPAAPLAEVPIIIAMQIINPDTVPAADLLTKLKGVVAAETPGAAVLTWDVRRGHLLNKLGDIVAYANERAVAIPPPVASRGFSRSPPPPAVAASPAAVATVPLSLCDGAEKRAFARVPQSTAATTSPITCNGLGDIEAVQKVVDKWRVVEEIRQRALQDAFAITLTPSDGLYHQDDKVTLSVSSQRQPYFTLFNIGSDGTVNFLYPLTGGQYNDPLEIPIGRSYQLELTVQSPFGADHFIAIASKEPLRELHRDLAALDGKQAAYELSGLLKRDTEGKLWEVGLHGVYTAPKP